MGSGVLVFYVVGSKTKRGHQRRWNQLYAESKLLLASSAAEAAAFDLYLSFDPAGKESDLFYFPFKCRCRTGLSFHDWTARTAVVR